MDGQRFDAITSAWATNRFTRRSGLQLLAGFALGTGIAGFDLTAADKKKGKGKGKGKNKKKPPECPGIRKRCGEECISFLRACCKTLPASSRFPKESGR